MNRMERYLEIARGAIERHLGDVCDGETDSADRIYDEAFVLAHDALLDQGIDAVTASRVARQAALLLAQP